MASKYPPFERTTSGQLHQGDLLLLRDRQADTLWDSSTPPERIPHGLHRVIAVDSVLHGGGYRRAQRVYLLTLKASADSTVRVARVSPGNRINRVTS